MAEIVNLRTARKRKERLKADEEAAANREKHGVSTKIRKLTREIQAIEKTKLDGKKRDT